MGEHGPERAKQLEAKFGRGLHPDIADNHQIGNSLPQGAVHQGVALRPAPLEDADLADFEARPGADHRPVVRRASAADELAAHPRRRAAGGAQELQELRRI